MTTLSDEDKAKYTPIIDAILRKSDLSTISVKKVRNGLAEQTGLDFVPLKKTIDTLITDRFDILLAERDNPAVAAAIATAAAAAAAAPPAPAPAPPTPAAVKSEPSTSTTPEPSAGSGSSVDEDARLAAELHAQLNGGRATRTSKPTKAAARKRSNGKQKKSKDTVDSDVSGDEETEPAKKKRKANPNNAFMKPLILSAPLAAFIGEAQMSRPEVVKKIWAYVKSNDLQDPNDRRYIICDESLKPVFGEKVHMFTMNKVLATNMYKVEEVAVKPETMAEAKSEVKEEEGSS